MTEILVVLAIMAALAALLVPAAKKALAQSKTAVSSNNLRQIFGAIQGYAADNNGNMPFAFSPFGGGGSATPLPAGGMYWYDAVRARLYPERTAAQWADPKLNLTGTVLRSPNAEKDWPLNVETYGYNMNFNGTKSGKHYLSYPASATVLLADVNGKTRGLTPIYASPSHSKLNARNGASRDYASDGTALAIFLDGHLETLTAARCRELNAITDGKDPFWGLPR